MLVCASASGFPDRWPGSGKFNAPASVPEGGAAQSFTVAFADMGPGDDSKVKDRKVKPELVTQVVLLDATALSGGVTEERDNRLRLTALRALARK